MKFLTLDIELNINILKIEISSQLSNFYKSFEQFKVVDFNVCLISFY